VILESFNCDLISLFGVIVQMRLALFLGRYRWYQIKLISCGTEALHDIDLDGHTKELSGERL